MFSPLHSKPETVSMGTIESGDDGRTGLKNKEVMRGGNEELRLNAWGIVVLRTRERSDLMQ